MVIFQIYIVISQKNNGALQKIEKVIDWVKGFATQKGHLL